MVSDKYVRHEDGRRGVIISELNYPETSHYQIVVCETGDVESWHSHEIYWLFLLLKEDW